MFKYVHIKLTYDHPVSTFAIEGPMFEVFLHGEKWQYSLMSYLKAHPHNAEMVQAHTVLVCSNNLNSNQCVLATSTLEHFKKRKKKKEKEVLKKKAGKKLLVFSYCG